MKKTTFLNLLILAALVALAIPAIRQSLTVESDSSDRPLRPTLPAEALPLPGAALAQAQPAIPPAVAEDGPQDSANFAAAASIIANGLHDVHLLRLTFDESRSAMAWTNFLAALDIDRMYFRQEDLDALDGHRLRLPAEMNDGNLSFAHQAADIFRKRVDERAAFVNNLLDGDFDFSVDEYYVWRRRDSPWPATIEEQDDLWRRRIKNEMLLRILNRELDEEKASEKESENPETETPESRNPENPETESRKPETERPAEAGASSAESAVPESPVPETPAEYLRKRYAKLREFFEDCDDEYYISRFLTATCESFDPHTDYFSPATQEDFDIGMQLSLQGIGATLQTEDGTAKITEIVPGGPADRDTRDIRLVPGDRIIAVAQEGDVEFTDILHWPLYKAVRLIRGPKGTRVRLLVQCADDPTHSKTRVVDLVRDEVKLEEQAATSALETFTDASGRERRVGVVTLPTFYAGGGTARTGATARSATADIARLLEELNSQDIEGLILDLRGNGGGALGEAVSLAGLFIRTGPVVQVQERNRTVPLKDYNPAVIFRGPMVVLVDRLSASASEIVAGALQDYGRAIVIGDSRTHGKGTVQQIMPLDNGNLGSIKDTNAGFFRITGDSTQIKGVSSDIVLPSAFEYYSELGEDKLPNAIPWRKINGTPFRRVSNLAPVIEALRAKSEERLLGDERWQTHLRRMEAIRRFNEATSVPLEREKRLDQLREERRVFDSEDPAPGNVGNDDDEESRPRTRAERAAARRARDVVLDETLRIVADFADMQETADTGEKRPRPVSIPDIFQKFFP